MIVCIFIQYIFIPEMNSALLYPYLFLKQDIVEQQTNLLFSILQQNKIITDTKK